MSRNNYGEVKTLPTQTNSNVVSMNEFRERKNYQGGVLEYPCVDIISYELADFDGNKFTTIRFDNE
jgi:hypothetical protein